MKSGAHPLRISESEAFFDAIRKGDASKVREILARDRSMVNAKSEKGFTAVTTAGYYGKEDIMGILLDHRPTLGLHDAAIVGDLERVKGYVERNVTLANDASSPDGFPPLGLAAHFGRPEVVVYLLSKGADVNFAAPGIGFTALTGAIAGGHREVVKILLAAGANVNHRYEDRQLSPLITAAGDGDPAIVEMLIRAGADVNVRTKDGKTPLAFALERKHPAVADILRKHGAT